MPYLELAGGAKAGALVELELQCGIDLIIGMADNCRAPAADVVDVLVSIDVPAVGVLDTLKDDGPAAH